MRQHLKRNDFMCTSRFSSSLENIGNLSKRDPNFPDATVGQSSGSAILFRGYLNSSLFCNLQHSLQLSSDETVFYFLFIGI